MHQITPGRQNADLPPRILQNIILSRPPCLLFSYCQNLAIAKTNEGVAPNLVTLLIQHKSDHVFPLPDFLLSSRYSVSSPIHSPATFMQVLSLKLNSAGFAKLCSCAGETCEIRGPKTSSMRLQKSGFLISGKLKITKMWLVCTNKILKRHSPF